MDTTDLTNRIQDEQEQEELNEQVRMDEEDRGLDKQGEEPDEVPEESKYPNLSNPMIDYEPQEELDRVSNRESYSFFQNNCETE